MEKNIKINVSANLSKERIYKVKKLERKLKILFNIILRKVKLSAEKG